MANQNPIQKVPPTPPRSPEEIRQGGLARETVEEAAPPSYAYDDYGWIIVDDETTPLQVSEVPQRIPYEIEYNSREENGVFDENDPELLWEWPHPDLNDPPHREPKRFHFGQVYNSPSKKTFRNLVDVIIRRLGPNEDPNRERPAAGEPWRLRPDYPWQRSYFHLGSNPATKGSIFSMTILFLVWTWFAGLDMTLLLDENNLCRPEPFPNADHNVMELVRIHSSADSPDEERVWVQWDKPVGEVEETQEGALLTKKEAVQPGGESDDIDIRHLHGFTSEDHAIIKGWDAKIQEWPWVVAIGTQRFPGQFLYEPDVSREIPHSGCSGSILHREWVLTAQHCVPQVMDSHWVTAGVDCRPEFGGITLPTAQVRQADRVYHYSMKEKMEELHGVMEDSDDVTREAISYSWLTLVAELHLGWRFLTPVRMTPDLEGTSSDLALLHLNRPLVFNNHVSRVELPFHFVIESPELPAVIMDLMAGEKAASQRNIERGKWAKDSSTSGRKFQEDIRTDPGHDLAEWPSEEHSERFRTAAWGDTGLIHGGAGGWAIAWPSRLQWVAEWTHNSASILTDTSISLESIRWKYAKILFKNYCRPWRSSRFWCTLQKEDWTKTTAGGDSGSGWVWRVPNTGRQILVGVTIGGGSMHLSDHMVNKITNERQGRWLGYRGVSQHTKISAHKLAWMSFVYQWHQKHERPRLESDQNLSPDVFLAPSPVERLFIWARACIFGDRFMAASDPRIDEEGRDDIDTYLIPFEEEEEDDY